MKALGLKTKSKFKTRTYRLWCHFCARLNLHLKKMFYGNYNYISIPSDECAVFSRWGIYVLFKSSSSPYQIVPKVARPSCTDILFVQNISFNLFWNLPYLYSISNNWIISSYWLTLRSLSWSVYFFSTSSPFSFIFLNNSSIIAGSEIPNQWKINEKQRYHIILNKFNLRDREVIIWIISVLLEKADSLNHYLNIR